jgi:hypothetical protein
VCGRGLPPPIDPEFHPNRPRKQETKYERNNLAARSVLTWYSSSQYPNYAVDFRPCRTNTPVPVTNYRSYPSAFHSLTALQVQVYLERWEGGGKPAAQPPSLPAGSVRPARGVFNTDRRLFSLVDYPGRPGPGDHRGGDAAAASPEPEAQQHGEQEQERPASGQPRAHMASRSQCVLAKSPDCHRGGATSAAGRCGPANALPFWAITAISSSKANWPQAGASSSPDCRKWQKWGSCGFHVLVICGLVFYTQDLRAC